MCQVVLERGRAAMHIGVIIVLPLSHSKPFVTKFDMVVQHRKLECHAKKKR